METITADGLEPGRPVAFVYILSLVGARDVTSRYHLRLPTSCSSAFKQCSLLRDHTEGGCTSERSLLCFRSEPAPKGDSHEARRKGKVQDRVRDPVSGVPAVASPAATTQLASAGIPRIARALTRRTSSRHVPEIDLAAFIAAFSTSPIHSTMSLRGVSLLRSARRVTTIRSAGGALRTLGATRSHTTRDRYFLKPLKETEPEPNYDYRFLAEPATVEVSLASDAPRRDAARSVAVGTMMSSLRSFTSVAETFS